MTRETTRVLIAAMVFLFIVALFAVGCTKTVEPAPPAKLGAPPNAPSVQVAAVPAPQVLTDSAPVAARKYRADLVRNSRVVWGINAPVALFGAQVEQESSWNPNAQSAYASGLAQFTPATADWIDDVYAAELGPAQPLNPAWALRALVRYDRHLYERVTHYATDCDRHAFALAGYNGGPGWVQRDQNKAAVLGIDSARFWDAVEQVNAGRSAANFKENRDYPRRIVYKLQPRYAAWGPSVCV